MSPFKKNAQKWVDALLSGDYTQTSGCLRTTTGFCCLGVACDLYLKATGNGEWHTETADGHTAYYFRVGDAEEGEILPEHVKNWLGLRGNRGDYHTDDDDKYHSLMKNNDDGWTFEAIAAVIKERPKGLFV